MLYDATVRTTTDPKKENSATDDDYEAGLAKQLLRSSDCSNDYLNCDYRNSDHSLIYHASYKSEITDDDLIINDMSDISSDSSRFSEEVISDEVVFRPDDNSSDYDSYASDTPQVLLTPPMLHNYRHHYKSVRSDETSSLLDDTPSLLDSTSPIQIQQSSNTRRSFLRRKKKSTIRLPDVPPSVPYALDSEGDGTNGTSVTTGGGPRRTSSSFLHAGASTSRTVAWMIAKTLKRRGTTTTQSPSPNNNTSISFEEAAGSFVGKESGSHLAWLRSGTEATLIVTQKGYAIAASVTVKLKLVPSSNTGPTINVAHEPLLLVESSHKRRALILDTSRLPTTDPKVLEGLKDVLPANEATAEVLGNIGNNQSSFVSIPVSNSESKSVVLLLKDTETAQRTIDAIMALQTYVQVYGCPTITSARARAAS